VICRIPPLQSYIYVFSLHDALSILIHRNYNFSGSILVSVFDDRIEVTSLGGLMTGLSIDDIIAGVSQTRNKNLANIFYRLEYVRSEEHTSELESSFDIV